MLVKTFGYAVQGINATKITVEVNINTGVNFFLVGLPDNAVKESQQRIDTALKEHGYKIPGKQITVNMAPADIRKEGSAYDLTIAMGILAASEQIPMEKAGDYVIMGELALDGELRSIKGSLPIAINARQDGFKGIILPASNAQEAAVVSGLEVRYATNIKQVIDFFTGEKDLPIAETNLDEAFLQNIESIEFDFSDVKGQENIKRALEIAAAGGHNAILIGPPGAGKTMLSKRLPSILPPLTLEEALETTKIHSVAGKTGRTGAGLVTQRPFRTPHHTISDIALVGGGNNPQPGEISLAHNGVLFLDELPEFKRTVLEVMRQPIEDRVVTISRAKFSVEYPASFMLIASMNPCPCGYYNHPEKECVCAPGIVQKYLNKISGPLLDRIDLHIEVTPVPFSELNKQHSSELSKDIRARVIKARLLQSVRYEKEKKIHCNAQMHTSHLKAYCQLTEAGNTLLKNAMERLGLSARAYDRILKVARTIADLDNSKNIETNHIAEAIQYRSLDRDGWAG
ncbi:YifB family Mg chelatase-like AAA ATPase [Aurantibacillus circumpalustris]|uniref:YifB family Mg chelatase-like AAA ATPase n=1 Tax=Aurantibacillus circumpalustris TaxID=3036359 RepID=UPI00295BD588|nr:YifB family Mg chelatase-like AAA ATPase [Aurantibacillus circumpalustris]